MGHPKAHFYTRGWVGGGGVFLSPFKKKMGGGMVRKTSFFKEKVLKSCHQN
jgi:hypothetical protein